MFTDVMLEARLYQKDIEITRLNYIISE